MTIYNIKRSNTNICNAPFETCKNLIEYPGYKCICQPNYTRTNDDAPCTKSKSSSRQKLPIHNLF